MDQQQTGNPTGNSRSVRCCSTICRSGCKASVPSKTRMRCKTLIRSLPWKGLMIVFYTFVLFGNPLYLLCSIDEMVYDILAGVTFVFCVVEMILRILAEPGYMKIDIVLVGSNRFLLSGSEPNKALPLGSFLFWCDLFSSGVILYHIIWINAATGRLKTVEIFLDSDGLPVSVLLVLRRDGIVFSRTLSSGLSYIHFGPNRITTLPMVVVYVRRDLKSGY